MSNPSKKKGTEGETKVVKYLVSHGVTAERRALSGSSDKGDIKMLYKGIDEMTLEVKTGKQTVNPSRSQIEEWIKQTNIEAENAGCRGALVIVRFRRSIEDAEVYMPGMQWHGFLYLDQFAQMASG